MGQAEVGWVMQGQVDHAGLVWCGHGVYVCGGVGHVGWGQVGHPGVGSGGSYRVGMGWVMKNIKILKILNYWCYRVSNQANQKICRY